MADLERLRALIEPLVATSGFELVRLSFSGGDTPTLQVMLEDPATGQMQVDDCAAVSRKLSAMLDSEDPIDGEYLLEVSSPGIDRPLTRRKDYERYAGHDAKVELAEARPVDGASRKRFQGLLLGLDGDQVQLRVDGLGDLRLPLAGIASAKLLLTDRLIRDTMPPQDGDDTPSEPRN